MNKANKIKVLHVFNQITFSGAELMYSSASSIFINNGVELFAINTSIRESNFIQNFRNNGFNVFHIPLSKSHFPNLNNFVGYLNIIKILKRNKIDVIHIHRESIYFLGVVAFILRIKCIKTFHSVFVNPRSTHGLAIIKRYLLREIFLTKMHSIGKSVYENELKYYKNKTVLINNWYNDLLFKLAENNTTKSNNRSKLNLPSNKFILLSVGNCSVVKNHKEIIAAINILKKKDDIFYIHIGVGEQEDEEKLLCQDYKLNDKIEFVGHKSNVNEYLAACDLYLMPSKHEGLSIAGVEAMGCGIPVVLYNVPGLCDLIENENIGYLVEPNYHQLAKTIDEIMENYDVALKKAINANKLVKEKYSMTKNVLEIIKLYGE